MDAELKSLEEKIDQLVTLYKDVCSENIILQQQLVEVTSINDQLTAKINIVVSRLQTLLRNLPEN